MNLIEKVYTLNNAAAEIGKRLDIAMVNLRGHTPADPSVNKLSSPQQSLTADLDHLAEQLMRISQNCGELEAMTSPAKTDRPQGYVGGVGSRA